MDKLDVLASYVPTGSGNVYMDRDGWGVSYNTSPGSGLSMFASDGDGDETAIVSNGDFYILNGDFRREYAELAESGGLDACLRFFASKPELKSSWSNDVDLASLAGAAP